VNQDGKERKENDMSISGIGGGAGYNPYVVMNTSQQSQGMQKPQGSPLPKGDPPSAEEMYSKADSNGDAYISQAEMAGVLSMGQSDELSEDGLQMYADADVDGDGQLSQDEFNTQMEKMSDEMGPQGPDGDADADDSGQISFQGFDSGSTTGSSIYQFIQNLSDQSSLQSSGAVYA
jgi:hypothetical protein